MEPSAIARQAQINRKLSYSRVAKENDVMLGALISQKSGIDFMQNCDLPPPIMVFMGLDMAVALSMNRVCSMGRENDEHDQFDQVCRNEGEGEKLELLKALRLSQTRAREAERKAACLAKKKERISNAFMIDTLQFFCLPAVERKRLVQEGTEGGNGDEMSWLVALALCLGIASVGFAFGCIYCFE
ncbi:hypothetical protein CRYUN_Cryun22dG0075800 [Craigia yunnanensis]